MPGIDANDAFRALSDPISNSGGRIHTVASHVVPQFHPSFCIEGVDVVISASHVDDAVRGGWSG